MSLKEVLDHDREHDRHVCPPASPNRRPTVDRAHVHAPRRDRQAALDAELKATLKRLGRDLAALVALALFGGALLAWLTVLIVPGS